MKYCLLLFPALFYFAVCPAESIKEKAFKQTVQAVVSAFSKHDSLALSRYIHPKEGVCLLYRHGVFDHYVQLKMVSFKDEDFPQVIFKNAEGIAPAVLQYGRLPKYSCEKESWSKRGLWTDTTKTDHMVSNICKNRNKYVPDHIPVKTIKAYYRLESKSRRLVLVAKDEKELVFNLSYIDGKWYLTIFDHVSSDCSA